MNRAIKRVKRIIDIIGMNGVEIFKKQGARVKEGEIIFKIYSNSQSNLKRAERIYIQKGSPIIFGGMLIERV